MKNLSLFVIIMFTAAFLRAQESTTRDDGQVSFITSQSVYVKFKSTSHLAIGDTLYKTVNGQSLPVLKITNLSSISCVCTPISSVQLSVSDKISPDPDRVKTEVSKEVPVNTPQTNIVIPKADSTVAKTPLSGIIRKPLVSGMMSASMNTNFSNQANSNSTRAQYTMMLNARNIDSSRFSLESYISFVYRDKYWDEVKTDIFNALKIYNLAVSYEAGQHAKIWLGRRINQKISSMGPVDGLQFEQKLKSFTIGVLAGTRPDYQTYGFNSSLLQYGGYLNHELTVKNGSIQNTLAFIEQKNNGNTDRRFIYFQHSSNISRKLSLFGSAEFDLYNMTFNSTDSTFAQDNSPRMSNLYASLRYRIIRPLSVSFTYSSRKNVVYYETYKTFLERLLDGDNQQGYSAQVNFHPKGIFSIGVNGSYRLRDKDPNPTKNVYTYITLSQIPRLNVTTTFSATLLETSYMSGKIFSAGFSKDLFKGKVNTGIDYRFVNYNFTVADVALNQHMGEVYFSWRMYKKLSMSVYYEGTFETGNKNHRVYAQMRMGF